MEVYKVPEQEYADAYLIHGSKLNGQFANQNLESFEAMHNEGVPQYVVDQSMYYPTATNYGYICTGFESPSEWDDHQMVFGLDGQDVPYAGAELDNFPFVYYTPSFQHAQSPYNPYNPYIPGAVVGVDGSFMGTQQYYALPYDYHSSSSVYFPMLVQSTSDAYAHNASHTYVDTFSATAHRANGPTPKHNLSSASPAFGATPWPGAASQTGSYIKAERSYDAAGSSKCSMAKGNVASSGLSSHLAPSPGVQGKGSDGMRNLSNGRTLPSRSQLKVNLSCGNALTSFRPSTITQNAADKVQSKFLYGKVQTETKVSADKFREDNQAPKLGISGNKLTVRAFTSRAGEADKQGNITIYLDQYDKHDFRTDYVNAKFFIIKSYSEDDVHKSTKYGVWSSTPNGNKKLNSAYEDAKRICSAISGSCPVFLFFSVNASGQFCGVAEMTGPVDFQKDMDFWQQDKWSGSFPVKWHLIKDVPNPSFRHIILENNDNKPVTNSRDTQELRYKKGMEMLRTFKNYLSKTSLLDDFLYYENRQRILQEEKKSRLLMKNYNHPFFAPVLEPPRMLTSVLDEGDKTIKMEDSSGPDRNIAAAGATGAVGNLTASNSNATVGPNGGGNIDMALKIGSLTITPALSRLERLEAATVTGSDSSPNDILKVGSIPVKVNGFAEPGGFLTFGSIPLHSEALQQDVSDSLVKGEIEKDS